MPEPMIRMTDAAAERVRHLMSLSEAPAVGLRVGVRTRGCSGLSYSVEYANERKPYEEAIESNGVTVLIDPTAVMFLIGSVMDYRVRHIRIRLHLRKPQCQRHLRLRREFSCVKSLLGYDGNKRVTARSTATIVSSMSGKRQCRDAL